MHNLEAGAGGDKSTVAAEKREEEIWRAREKVGRGIFIQSKEERILLLWRREKQQKHLEEVTSRAKNKWFFKKYL